MNCSSDRRTAEPPDRLPDVQHSAAGRDGRKIAAPFSLRFQENIQLKHDIPLGKGLVGYAVQHQQAVLVPDVNKDPRYILLNPETRSELAVP